LTFLQTSGQNIGVKITNTTAMKTLLLAIAVLGTALITVPARAADDTYVLFEEGKAAFQAGQFEIAREKLNKVAERNPNHVPTQAMLAQIKQKIGVDNTKLRNTYATVIIDKIDFADVSLEEAVEALRMLAKKASGDKVVPNIIIKSPEIGQKTVTLNLSKVPLTEVLNYLAEVTGARLTYDTSAVLFSNRAG
jgi:tetratricopeptide (TPR) repeat protein